MLMMVAMARILLLRKHFQTSKPSQISACFLHPVGPTPGFCSQVSYIGPAYLCCGALKKRKSRSSFVPPILGLLPREGRVVASSNQTLFPPGSALLTIQLSPGLALWSH